LGCQIAQHLQRLVPGRPNKTTRIDDQNTGPGRVFNQPVTRAPQQLRHGLRINRVLGTTQGDQMESIKVHDDVKLPQGNTGTVGVATGGRTVAVGVTRVVAVGVRVTVAVGVNTPLAV